MAHGLSLVTYAEPRWGHTAELRRQQQQQIASAHAHPDAAGAARRQLFIVCDNCASIFDCEISNDQSVLSIEVRL